MRHLLILCLTIGSSLLGTPMDLENVFGHDAVISTKRILIPQFPYAFNPSLVKWKNKLLLSFRAGKEYVYEDEIPLPSEHTFEYDFVDKYSPNRMVLVLLDADLNPCSAPQILDVPNYNSTYRQQDPRLIVVGERLFIVYSEIVRGISIDYTRRMCVGEIFEDKGYFYTKNVETLLEFEGAKENVWEKNWAPFDYEGELLLTYSLNPHKILRPMLGSHVCYTLACTQTSLDWKWGTLRGGTQAIQISDQEYLGIFHSSTVMASAHSDGKKRQHYFMGAYTFAAHPPFALTRISPTPIVGPDFYHGKAYKTWKPLVVVFPGGLVDNDPYLLVAYGRQDHEMWIATFDKDALLSSLIPVD